ncbi:MAG: DUF2748 family protein [Alphaproteobacteria bacterium]|nr:DUF2748 family protein [Alphaproteobacteria bacterium]
MATNLYHLLAFLPATEAWEMPPALEALAQALVSSGKLRINAEHERNFVRYGSAVNDLTFTARELTDPQLGDATRARVARLVAPAMGAQGLADIWDHLRRELKKARGVAAEKEIKVARVLVQSAHPAVIHLLLSSGTEIFVSYFHNVADLMAVHAWQTHGTSSGLQATEGEGTAVYVSAGGDPFFEGTQKTYATDGFPALARMVVIAGQELGHFADLRRSAAGITGRHSTDAHHSRLRANPIAAAGRLADMRRVAELTHAYQAAGLARLRRTETRLAFYHARLRYSPPWLLAQVWRFTRQAQLIHNCKRQKLLHHFNTLPRLYLGDAIEQYLADMGFNLAPDAEVYRNPDPLVEEAIAVIEAVARVPQQEHKWGRAAVQAAWPELHRFYYGTVIPACEAAARTHTPDFIGNKDIIINSIQKLVISLRRRIRPRPAYYP